MKYQKGDCVVTSGDCGVVTKVSSVSSPTDLERMIFEVRFQSKPQDKFTYIWSGNDDTGMYLWSIDADVSDVKKIIRGSEVLWEC
tara:strand:- start:425 stop:679 length:255 start_codon:yes stop_codon:yes gene_type:complete